MKDSKRRLTIAGLVFLIAAGTSPAQSNEAALIAKAKPIHDRVIKLDNGRIASVVSFRSEHDPTEAPLH